MAETAYPQRLSPSQVRNAKPREKAYKLADGGGLYLLVQPNGARLWRYKYRIHGRENVVALGVFPDVGLADARTSHSRARALVASGIHPAEDRRQNERNAQESRARAERGTFAAVAGAWSDATAHKLAPATREQRRRELALDVLPGLGARPIEGITRAELAGLVKTVESRAPEVARNVRAHLVHIFEYAAEAGLIDASPVPSAKILRRRSQIPHMALPVAQVPTFLRALDDSHTSRQTAIAMRLVMLTLARKSEVIGARWAEFDLDGAEWTVPAERMKTRRPHWVPLSSQAAVLLAELRTMSHGEFLFPNRNRPGEHMAGRTLNAVMERIGFAEEAKVHGFRSMASSYLNECGWNPDAIERALAHQDGNRIRAIYNRAQYGDERRRMLQAWADHLSALEAGALVVPIGRVA